MNTLKSTITLCITLLIFASILRIANAQIPQDIPHQSEPVDFTSGWNILIYIVLPIMMVVYYYWWRKKQRKK
jgi:cytochrome bd-type quinol oxidase subunit 2